MIECIEITQKVCGMLPMPPIRIEIGKDTIPPEKIPWINKPKE